MFLKRLFGIPTRYTGQKVFDRNLDAVRCSFSHVRSFVLRSAVMVYRDSLSVFEGEVSRFIWLVFSSRSGEGDAGARRESLACMNAVKREGALAARLRHQGWRGFTRRLRALLRSMYRFFSGVFGPEGDGRVARFVFGLIGVIFLMTACGQDGLDGGKGRRGTVSFTVCAPGQGTKGAVSASGEFYVGTLDLLAFRADDGALDSYVHAVSDSYVEGTVTLGVPLNWYIVANAPAAANLQTMATETQFLASSTLLTHTTASSMVMSATGTDTFGPGTNEIDDVALSRYACKVSVNRVKVSWLGEFATAPSCTVDRIVLMNVRGSELYSGTPTALAGDLWYNCSEDDGSHSAGLAALLGWSGSVVVSGGTSPVDLYVSLYAMPNPSTTAQFAGDLPWAPRKTRIAVQMTIGGVPQWYAIDLPAMVRNTHYYVDLLEILGPGTASPDMDVDRTSVAFSVSVTDWADNDVEGGSFPVQ